jgi:hypothetical protein
LFTDLTEQLPGSFDIHEDTTSGQWDLVYTNTCGTTVTKKDAFKIMGSNPDKKISVTADADPVRLSAGEPSEITVHAISSETALANGEVTLTIDGGSRVI